jgi:hypothetical protein
MDWTSYGFQTHKTTWVLQKEPVGFETRPDRIEYCLEFVAHPHIEGIQPRKMRLRTSPFKIAHYEVFELYVWRKIYDRFLSTELWDDPCIEVYDFDHEKAASF